MPENFYIKKLFQTLYKCALLKYIFTEAFKVLSNMISDSCEANLFKSKQG